GGGGWAGAPRDVRPHLWPHWMKPWVCALISGPVMSSSIWAVRWPSLCRLRRRRCCCGGRARGRSVRRPCGSGAKRQGGCAWRRPMAQRPEQLQAVAQGPRPTEEPLPAQLEAAPLLLGADGVMVPFRPEGEQPRGKTAWHEVKVGVLARLGHHRTRTGKVVARLHQRRLVAVLGAIDAL